MVESNIESLSQLLAENNRTKDAGTNVPSWKIYVVRKRGFSKNLYDNSDQKIYGKMMHRTVQKAAEYLNCGDADFDDLSDFLCQRRRKIALHLQPYNLASIDFGILREIGPGGKSITYCKKDYAGIPFRLFERIAHKPTENLTIDSEGRLQLVEKLNGKSIQLSNYEFYNLDKWSEWTGNVHHTSPDNARIVMKYVKHTLFPRAIKEEDPASLQKSWEEYFGGFVKQNHGVAEIQVLPRL